MITNAEIVQTESGRKLLIEWSYFDTSPHAFKPGTATKLIPVDEVTDMVIAVGPQGGIHYWHLLGHAPKGECRGLENTFSPMYDNKKSLFSGGRGDRDGMKKVAKLLDLVPDEVPNY